MFRAHLNFVVSHLSGTAQADPGLYFRSVVIRCVTVGRHLERHLNVCTIAVVPQLCVSQWRCTKTSSMLQSEPLSDAHISELSL